ncbi:MAG: bifunctional nicotinamidase/pyrazinamidase [Bacillota bacterium]|nr:MAG: bifunctional nicotinamidase/pyrazinamidase [Bacillota bacterium]
MCQVTQEIRLQPGDALIIVDVQNDFCPGGALAVPQGDQVVPVLNRWIEEFHRRGLPVVYTQDWHPQGHCSFRDQGGPWPVHCVQDTPGAAFHPDLLVKGEIFRKAYLPEPDAYSGMEARRVQDGRLQEDQPLPRWLREQGVRRVLVGGLATDYCVRATVLDALREGFQVVVLRDGVRAVDVQPGDGERALREMAEAGAVIA